MRYAAILVAVGVGYVIGRARPFDLLSAWTEDQFRLYLDRWDTAPKRAALFGLLLLTDHDRAIRAFQARTKGKGEES